MGCPGADAGTVSRHGAVGSLAGAAPLPRGRAERGLVWSLLADDVPLSRNAARPPAGRAPRAAPGCGVAVVPGGI